MLLLQCGASSEPRVSLRAQCHLRRVDLRIDIIPDSNEFLLFVTRREQQHGDLHDVLLGNQSRIRSGRSEHELVLPDYNGTDQHGVELLIVLLVGGGTDVSQLPFELCITDNTRKSERGSESQ